MPHTASVLIITPLGVPLVRAHKKTKWALPGGKGNKGETPQETVRRETLEETGLVIGDLEILSLTSLTVRGEKVAFHIFLTYLEDIGSLNKSGDEEEAVRMFTVEEVLVLSDALFFGPHRRVVLPTLQQRENDPKGNHCACG